MEYVDGPSLEQLLDNEHVTLDMADGLAVGIISGVGWALTIIGLRWLGVDRPAEAVDSSAASAVVCGNVIACLAALPAALPIKGATPTDWTVIAWLGIFQVALAYIFLVRGIRRVGALEASLLILLEPVLSPLWAWLFHGERPSDLALLGGALIVAATAIYTWFDKNPQENEEVGSRN